MADVKPTIPLNPDLELDQTIRIESSSKRKRHPYQTPRKSKLRKLNASQYVSDNCTTVLSNNSSTASTPKKSSHIRGVRTKCAFFLFILCATACALAPTSISIIPRQLIDIYHECQQQFEHELNAFMYDQQPGDEDAAAAQAQLLATTMQRLHERVAHQNAALDRIEEVLRNHSVAAPTTQTTTAMAFVGGSGTGKTLSAGILMRDWLHRPRSNLLHFVWTSAIERPQQFLPEIVEQLSRYERNLLVIDSIPAHQHRSVAGFHRELLTHLAATRGPAALLAVYVLNVPTFRGADIDAISDDAPERSDIVAQMLSDGESLFGEQQIVPVVFESLTSPDQLRECIERERQRLRRKDAVTEEQVQLIGEGIDVRQSGCKHVGARMAMYL